MERIQILLTLDSNDATGGTLILSDPDDATSVEIFHTDSLNTVFFAESIYAFIKRRFPELQISKEAESAFLKNFRKHCETMNDAELYKLYGADYPY